MSSICLPRDVNVESDVKIGGLKTLNTGGRMAFVSNKDKKLIYQAPEMYAPFGVSEWVNENDGSKKYDLQLSLKDMETRESLKHFYKFKNDLDNKVVNEGFNNSAKFFGKKYSNKAVVTELYNKSIKHYTDPESGEISDKYPPNFKVKIPMRDNEFKVEVYDENQNLVDPERLRDNSFTKGARITAIIECSGVWVIGGKFGTSYRLVQLQVKPKQTISGFSFQNVEEDRIKGDEDIDEVNNNMNEVKLNDSDDDDV